MTAIDLSGLPPAALEVLLDAGWTPERRVPTDRWDDVLIAEGFHPSDIASALLAQLGGLQVTPPRDAGAAFANEGILFDPVLAGTGSVDIAERLTVLTGQDFYPLAEWVAASCVYVGSEGCMCGYRDGEIFGIGESVREGLRVMLLADAPLTVLERV